MVKKVFLYSIVEMNFILKRRKCSKTLFSISLGSTNEEFELLFFRGKGGIDKTAYSSMFIILWAKVCSSMLIITTDPAQNLSNSFQQKITKTPTLVCGFLKFYVMEVYSNVEGYEQTCVWTCECNSKHR